MILGHPTIFDLNKVNREKMSDSKVVKRYVGVIPGMENEQRTARLFYHIRKSLKDCMLLLDQTFWQYWYSSVEMLLLARDEKKVSCRGKDGC